MKKAKNIAALSLLTLALAACGAQEDKSPEITPPVDADQEFEESGDEGGTSGSLVFPDLPVDDIVLDMDAPEGAIELPENLPISEYEFKLTPEEEAIYARLKAELTSDVFEGVNPVSVAKIYIQCGIDGEWEAEWATFAPETITVEKEDFEAASMAARPAVESGLIKISADWTFPFIEEGTFTQEGNRGQIQFPQAEIMEDGEELPEVILNLVQNEKGIWEMQYNPVSFPTA